MSYHEESICESIGSSEGAECKQFKENATERSKQFRQKSSGSVIMNAVNEKNKFQSDAPFLIRFSAFSRTVSMPLRRSSTVISA